MAFGFRWRSFGIVRNEEGIAGPVLDMILQLRNVLISMSPDFLPFLRGLIFPVVALVFFPQVFSQEEPTLASLKKELAAEELKLSEPLFEFQFRYKKQLEDLKAKSQQAGDLNQMLAVESELKLLAVGGSEIDEEFAELKRLRTVYENHAAKLLREKAVARRKLLPGYLRKLLALQTSLTKAGKIEEAVAVKREADGVRSALASGQPGSISANSVAPPTQRNMKSGKLILFGSYEKGGEVSLTDEQEKAQYVRIAAGFDHWMALTVDGKPTCRPDCRKEFIIPRGTKDIVDIYCGANYQALRKADGEIIPLAGPQRNDLLPKVDHDDVVKVSLGYQKNAFLMKDGTMIPFGYDYGVKGRKFTRIKLLSNVRDVSAGVFGYAIWTKENTFHNTGISGEDRGPFPEDIDPDDIVQMEMGLTGGCLFLTKKGKVLSWGGPKPPENLPKAKRIVAGSGVGGAQLEDDTWVLFANYPDAKVKKVKLLNTKLAELGPLKDIAVGTEFFLAIQ